MFVGQFSNAMRSKKKNSQGLSVRAISGTHVVFLAFDLSATARKGCLGFAIKRQDRTEGEEYWLEGMKTFESVTPHTGPGEKFSTALHPIQGMQWADYSAKPEHDYTFTVTAMYGRPGALRKGATVAVEISTESSESGNHRIVFNRGAVASQEYVRRFQNQKPSEVGPAAYNWLSRGLEETIIDFVGKAKDSSYTLRGAIYEFQWPGVVKAFAEARERGADVKVVYDGLPKEKGPRAKNEAAIAEHGLGSSAIARTRGTIMHNKFIVLLRNDKPVEVLTGSTNMTENGLFGHLNCVHIVKNKDVAAQYLAYWKELAKDPAPADLRQWAEVQNPTLSGAAEVGTQVVFSPRRGLKALQWYGESASELGTPTFVTLAFGMNQVLQDVYGQDDGVLRIALMEKPGNGSGMEKGRADMQRIRSLPNVLVALGHHITANRFDRWLKEIDRVKSEVNVRWIHTKFMLIDPLGDDPLVITGSANFSKAATDANDENMLVIRGERSVADIYFTEFLRVYAHHAFRESVKRSLERNETDWRPEYLKEDVSWQTHYFTSGNELFLRREYFVGS